jgi:hypothetical protein
MQAYKKFYVKIRQVLTHFNPLILFLLQTVPIDYDGIRFYAIFGERPLYEKTLFVRHDPMFCDRQPGTGISESHYRE